MIYGRKSHKGTRYQNILTDWLSVVKWLRLFRQGPSVEAGKNTCTVIHASRKRRRKGNPVVSDEIGYGYESSATLTTDRLHYKLQTRPLVREGAPRRRAKEFSGKRREEVKSGHGPQKGFPTPRYTDWLIVGRK
jgi:hypothetical protein